MKINPQIFRGYDIRGVVGKDLNSEIVEHIGKAYGTYIIKNLDIRKAVVARDSRATGEEFTEAFIKGITSTGIDVIDIGMTLVGNYYWAQYYLDCKGGAMITASHNPPEYNGFKLATGLSQAMISEETLAVREIAEKEDYIIAETPGKIERKDINEIYYKDILNRFKIEKKFKIVLDAGCATAGVIVPDLLRKFGMNVVEVNCNLDSSFPVGTPDPTDSAIMERLVKSVLENKADIGLTFDADGDRIGIVDEKGGIIWNDVLVAIFAQDVLEDHPGATIMYNTLCSKVVDETIKASGGVPFMWRTGHGFLKRKNEEVKAAFIGELSGHFFFSEDFYNHDDGAYSAVRLLNYLSRTNKTLSEAVLSLPKYISSPEIKVKCDDDKKVALTEKIANVLRADYKNAEVIDDERAGDGVRLEMNDAMFVIRYSQNGPYLTIKFEAKKQEEYDKFKKYIYELLLKYPEIDWEDKSHSVNTESFK